MQPFWGAVSNLWQESYLGPVIPLVYDYGKTNRLPPKYLVLGGEFSKLKYLVRIF